MPNIEAGPESLRDAAKGSRDMAGELRAVEPRTVDRFKRAMPGSGAALNAHRLTEYWEAKLKITLTLLDDRADKLIAAAKLYESGERDASEDFNRIMAPAQREKRYPGW